MATVGGQLCRPPSAVQRNCWQGVNNEDALRSVNKLSSCKLRTSHESICSGALSPAQSKARWYSRLPLLHSRVLLIDATPCRNHFRDDQGQRLRRRHLHVCAAEGSVMAAGGLRQRPILHRNKRNSMGTSVNGGKEQGLPPMAKVVKAMRRGSFWGLQGAQIPRW